MLGCTLYSTTAITIDQHHGIKPLPSTPASIKRDLGPSGTGSKGSIQTQAGNLTKRTRRHGLKMTTIPSGFLTRTKLWNSDEHWIRTVALSSSWVTEFDLGASSSGRDGSRPSANAILRQYHSALSPNDQARIATTAASGCSLRLRNVKRTQVHYCQGPHHRDPGPPRYLMTARRDTTGYESLARVHTDHRF